MVVAATWLVAARSVTEKTERHSQRKLPSTTKHVSILKKNIQQIRSFYFRIFAFLSLFSDAKLQNAHKNREAESQPLRGRLKDLPSGVLYIYLYIQLTSGLTLRGDFSTNKQTIYLQAHLIIAIQHRPFLGCWEDQLESGDS